ncbi:MAG: alpha/beta fold hydrolase [Planctomycetaceae bacterium]
MAERPDMTPCLPKLARPVLVICGRDDIITPLDEMRALAESIPGAQFVTIEEAGHMAPSNNRPQLITPSDHS